MTLAEAFARVEHLPPRDRVILGLLDEHVARWSSFDAEALGLLDDLAEANEIGAQLARTVEEFRSGAAQSAVVIMEISTSSYTVLALGPQAPSSVSEMVAAALKQLVARYAH